MSLNTMNQRPTHIDLGTTSFGGSRDASASSSRDLPSPRSGDVPPALSPLDAFAFQGRMLARKFEENHEDGRRISRLPTVAVANEFGRHRQNYFTSSAPTSKNVIENPSASASTQDILDSNLEMVKPETRPKSIHPFVQTFDDAASIVSRDSGSGHVQPLSPPLEEDEDNQPLEHETPRETESPKHLEEYFTFTSASPQGSRPESAAETHNAQINPVQRSATRQPPTSLSIATNLELGKGPATTPTTDYVRSNSSSNLAPPRSPAFARSPRYQSSIRSVRNDSGDDSDSISHLGDYSDPRFPDRRPSFTTINSSRPRSPFSPVFAPPRPPSANSDYSALASPYPRQSVNFSRPISRAGRQSIDSRPSIESSSRHMTVESPQLRPSLDVLSIQESIDTPPLKSTPFALDSNQFPPDEERGELVDSAHHPAPSYIYAKYSLPRGRILSRSSMLAHEQAKTTHLFQWEQPVLTEDSVTLRPFVNGELTRPSSSQGTSRPSAAVETDIDDFTHSRSRSADASKSEIPRVSQLSKPPVSDSATELMEVAAVSTIKASTFENGQSIGLKRDQMTPEEHLAQGISSHEEGALQKSTYHLRLAARAGLPTAMLLYALACRHGWGIRPNQAEGVAWLRKAVDSAGLEVAEDDGALGQKSTGISKEARDYLTEKQHRAQLALSIYELGVSYLNGWGVAQDKQLAVRCFVIAGSWGDADALAEAGFCYAKGVGCKKDLHKAADFYRKAEAKGIAMTGNSWIYKEKYMPTEELTDDRKSRSANKGKEKKPRDKSRTRTIFGGRKKGATQTPE